MCEREVLLGCNEPLVTEGLKLVLADRCHVSERTCSEEVVRDASTGNFDTVVLCVNSMSPLVRYGGGVLGSATGTIKAIKAALSVPVLVLSTFPEWRDDLIAAGANVFMTMPMNYTEFREAVSECLQRLV